MIYTDLCVMLGPQMALAYWLNAISQGPKKCRFPGSNPLPHALVMDAASIKSIMHEAVLNTVAEIANRRTSCVLPAIWVGGGGGRGMGAIWRIYFKNDRSFPHFSGVFIEVFLYLSIHDKFQGLYAVHCYVFIFICQHVYTFM
jgi:hypothetical protein